MAICLSHGVIAAVSPSPDLTMVATALAGYFPAPVASPKGDAPHQHPPDHSGTGPHRLTAILAVEMGEFTMSLFLSHVTHTCHLID